METITVIYNLIEKYQNTDIEKEFETFKPKIKGFNKENKELNLKAGDIIYFTGGYNNDIKFKSKILGFDSDGFAFVLWECYWNAIDLKKRLL